MRYLTISNDGSLDQDAIRFVGFSSKREDNTKIGFFGSGAKYAAAVLLRNGSTLSCVSDMGDGNKVRLDWERKKVNVRGLDTHEVVMSIRSMDAEGVISRAKKIPTNMTIDVGPTWEPWMAVREILSNAIDEGYLGAASRERGDNSEWDCPEGGTRFFIKMCPCISDVHEKWDNYFRFGDSEVIQEVDGKGRLLRSAGDGTRFYRKGILVQTSPKDGLYDYDFDYITINEGRKADLWYCEYRSIELLNKAPKKIKRKILTEAGAYETALGNCSNDLDSSWAEAIEEDELVGSDSEFKFNEGQLLGKRPAPVPSSAWISKLSKFDEVPTVAKKCSRAGLNARPVLSVDNREEDQLTKAVAILNRQGFDLKMEEIEVVEFEDGFVLGKASKDRISLSRKVLTMGMRELLATIIEEWSHRKAIAYDETRRFQNFLLDRIVELVAKKENAEW